MKIGVGTDGGQMELGADWGGVDGWRSGWTQMGADEGQMTDGYRWGLMGVAADGGQMEWRQIGHMGLIWVGADGG